MGNAEAGVGGVPEGGVGLWVIDVHFVDNFGHGGQAEGGFVDAVVGNRAGGFLEGLAEALQEHKLVLEGHGAHGVGWGGEAEEWGGGGGRSRKMTACLE